MKQIKKQSTAVVASFCMVSLFISMILCPLSASANDKVRLQLKWQHHFQFAGYYAAKAQGYYQAAGLDVDFIPAKPNDDPVDKVLQGKAEFGVGATDLLLRRERGAPIVVLAVIFQHSPLALLALKEDGLTSIHDLVGRKVQIAPGLPELKAYLLSEGIAVNTLTAPPDRSYPEDLMSGTADAVSTHVIGETFLLEKSGREYQAYSPRSVGIDFYGDNLFTTESMIRRDPNMVRAFRQASLKGWEYAMLHQEEMVQLIHAKYSHGHSIEHLRFEAHQMVPLLQTSLVEIGHMNPVRWRHIADVYAGLGMMKPNFNLKGFLYNPNPSPLDLRWIYGILAGAFLLIITISLVAVRFSRLSTALKESVTKYKNVADALRESERLHSSILDASPDGITILDNQGNIRMVSPAGVSMFGNKLEEELLGRNVIEFISPEDRERATSDFKLAFQGLFSGVGDYRAIRPDGSTFDIETKGQFLSDADGQPASLVLVVRDITERKQASHSCKVAMGEMISAIAHQWRQPLATLGMIVQRTHAVGTMQGLTDESLDEFKANAMRQIHYMSDTIEEFRNYYRPEKEKEPFSPLNCINDAARIFEPQLTSNNITVEVNSSGYDGQLVDGFPREFKQVVLNLLGNARDAILEIRAANGRAEAGRINVRMSVNKDDTLFVDISDNGCGIAPEIATRILEPYFTTKEKSGGTGLGLYMSKMIVEESLGGRFRQIPCQEGALFRIELQVEKTI